MNDLPPATSATSQGGRRRRTAWLAALVGLLLFLGGWTLWGPSFETERELAGPLVCSNNLRQIGLAITLYANEHRGAYPPSLDHLLLVHGLQAANMACPYTTDPVPIGTTAEELARSYRSGRRGSYVYVGAGLTSSADSDLVIAFEIPSHLSRNADRAANVLYADAHVENQSLSFVAQLLDELEAGHNPPRPQKLSRRQADALYNRRWIPLLSALRDGTWAATLPKPPPHSRSPTAVQSQAMIRQPRILPPDVPRYGSSRVGRYAPTHLPTSPRWVRVRTHPAN